MKYLILNRLQLTILTILFVAGLAFPLQAKADGIPINVNHSISYLDHRGFRGSINGQPIYCIQRGYPFRSAVSDMQMLRGEWFTGIYTPDYTDPVTGEVYEGSDGWARGTFSEIVMQMYDLGNPLHAKFFRGWGVWEMNGDHTDAVQASTEGAPSSKAWLEAYDEDKAHDEEVADDEDSKWENRYQGSGGIRKFFDEIGILSPDAEGAEPGDTFYSLLTGHEGTVDVYPTTMKQVNYTDVGFTMPQVYAMAMTNYYIYDDPDAAGYSAEAKYRVKQTVDWCIEFGFMTTVGRTGDSIRMLYQNSTGKYGLHGGNTYSGSCDGYVKTSIGGNMYEEMKLYRQMVWKTTNMRVIPSFASKIDNIGNAEPIKLYWDAGQRVYTATVADANGVLNYFDFNVPGCSVTNNGDGTLTITTPNQIGTVTSPGTQSKLEPADGVFKLPDFYRWDLEGKTKTFTVSMLVPDRTSLAIGSGWEEADNGNSLHREESHESEWVHSHTDYEPACNWFCERGAETVTHCDNDINFCQGEPNNCNNEINNCDKKEHTCNNDCAEHDCDCSGDYTDSNGQYVPHESGCSDGEKYCSVGYQHTHNANCHLHSKESDRCHSHDSETDKCHKHDIDCWHKLNCPYYQAYEGRGYDTYVNDAPIVDTGIPSENDSCTVVWCCGKQHFNIETANIEGTYIDWQDISGVYAKGQKLVDPEICYIKVETVPHEFPAGTDTEILLIADNDVWNNLSYTAPNGKVIKHADHIRVGEKYHLKYIYSYKGASKGFRIEYSLENKAYYQYNYLSRMQKPQNTTGIYNLRSGLTTDRFSQSSIGVPHARLVQDLTDIKIQGVYMSPETPYASNNPKVYTWNSGTAWDDKVYLDALTTDQYDDNYDNKSAGSITSTSGSSQLTDFTVRKDDNNILVVWEFDAEPEVFTSALVSATSVIDVGENNNYTRAYYDEAYNYAGTTSWPWSFEDHNQIGGVGYFNTGEFGEQVASHTVYTQNNEYRTYAVRNKVWQSDIDIKVSNFVQNTGAGITEHIYQERGRSSHDLNYNLYYTIDVENPRATIYADKQRAYDGRTYSDSSTTPYDTSSDVYEFDVNNLISWGSTGASQTAASYGRITMVDHVKTGTTYIQREIPTVLDTITGNQKETMTFSIYPNHDRLVYEDHYTNDTVSISGSGINRKVTVSTKDGYYPPNEQSAVSDIYPAMNPNLEDMQPQNINGAGNVPDEYNQNDDVLHHMNPTTSFNIKLSNGEIKTVVDSHTKTYTQYDFDYNPNNRNNKVTFPNRRKSIMFFKYSKTDYGYNGNSVQAAVGGFKGENRTQTESYYISQVLFKSNYTTKYKEELEAQGADYVEDIIHTTSGDYVSDSWIDMVNQNKFAIVSAGQGFELRVTVKYENSLLAQYLARYFGQDDAQNEVIGTSNRWHQEEQINQSEQGRQFCNISALTGNDGRDAPFYKDTVRAYVSSYSILDRLAVNLVTGANVFNDLYVFMGDNPDTVYSYSGIYDTPVIFDRDIQYSGDYSVTTVTYSMRMSQVNGISSNRQTMKFFTDQLAPDKKSPGIVEGTYDVSAKGEHSITIWTPVVAATPFDYPEAAQDRYIGDAIELGYTIKTTSADDSIVHIVQ